MSRVMNEQSVLTCVGLKHTQLCHYIQNFQQILKTICLDAKTKKKLKNFINSILLAISSSSISYADTVTNPERYILPSSSTMLYNFN
jgi:hypothetical protein